MSSDAYENEVLLVQSYPGPDLGPIEVEFRLGTGTLRVRTRRVGGPWASVDYQVVPAEVPGCGGLGWVPVPVPLPQATGQGESIGTHTAALLDGVHGLFVDVGFAQWLRQMHQETYGSAQEAYAQVARQLGLSLDNPA
jgi:hypothetical protein